MSIAALEQLLAREIGLNCHTLGNQAVAQAVRQRLAGEVLDEAAYLDRVRQSPGELQALIEAIMVPETWFFRDQEPFAFLARGIAEAWRGSPRRETLRLLSVPCATGEEPYSMAMTLLDAGLDPHQFEIEAADIHRGFLAKAETALYSRHSFRNSDHSFRDRYFDPVEDKFRLRPLVRQRVHFTWGNLLDPHFLCHAPPWHVIFCRNLLIYQHDDARAQILDVLDRRLRPQGWLFVGHAEMLPAFRRQYAPVTHPGAFAFQKRGASATDAAPLKPVRPQPPRPAAIAPGPNRPAPTPPSPACPAAAKPVPPADAAAMLERARRLADQGNFADAAALCEGALKLDGQNPQTYFLLGLIREKQGQLPAAVENMDRAIYLDANSYDAILHLSLLKARCGDGDAAERLRQRAARVYQRERTP